MSLFDSGHCEEFKRRGAAPQIGNIVTTFLQVVEKNLLFSMLFGCCTMTTLQENTVVTTTASVKAHVHLTEGKEKVKKL